ncbi:MAG TPA: SMC-Scp complex subunit ScpB [Bryobacteraceae bacterium]|nr:SMC-Scp complex subunit ScpB [Bryobacteraceae bacterium]
MEDREAISAGEQVEMAGEAESETLAEPITADDLFAEPAAEPAPVSSEDNELKAVIEAIIYVADDPLSLIQIATALGQPRERVAQLIAELVEEFDKPLHGLTIREVAGGYKMTTKPEHHEAVRAFVKNLKPPLKLSLPALETLAVIAYKQPVTGPEIMEIRGVQGAGVLKTLLDRKLIAVAGRKNVIGKPILYKTTKEFLVQFGLKDLMELPSLKEFEELRRMAMSDEPAPQPETTAETDVEMPPETAAEASAGDSSETPSEALPEAAAEASPEASAAEPPPETAGAAPEVLDPAPAGEENPS